MKRSQNALIQLIQTLDDGIEFYEIAKTKTQSAYLKKVFGAMVEIREFALAYIRPYVVQYAYEQDKSLSYHGSLTNRYAPLLSGTITDESLKLVHEIEEHLIDAMIHASVNSHNALVQCILKDLAPRICMNFDNCVREKDHAIAA